jgi:hypothetical protein
VSLLAGLGQGLLDARGQALAQNKYFDGMYYIPIAGLMGNN